MKIDELSVSERIILAEQLWDSVLHQEDTIELTENQQLELDRRMRAYQADNNIGSPWQDVKNRVIANR
jgi:putative addiction module component (TIGR02574 family)